MDLDNINSRNSWQNNSSSNLNQKKNMALVKCYICQKYRHLSKDHKTKNFPKNIPMRRNDQFKSRVNNVETSTQDLLTSEGCCSHLSHEKEDTDSDEEFEESPDLPLSIIKTGVNAKQKLQLVEGCICNRKV